jgi:glycosyltransferase involved in cell wall biosynthesis
MGMRLGLLDSSTEGWAAGGVYTRVVAHSLRAFPVLPPDVTVSLVGVPETPLRDLGLPLVPVPYGSGSLVARARSRVARLAGVSGLGLPQALLDRVGMPYPYDAVHVAARARLDVVLPARGLEHFLPENIEVVGWIPDFQHRLMPEMFTQNDIQFRDRTFGNLARDAKAVILSSEDAAGQFRTFYPDHAAKAVVARFPSLFAFEPPAPPDPAVLDRYGIPGRFAVVANQVWKHKNHRVVVAALGALKREGVDVAVVFTGTPLDYRDARNSNVSALLQQICRERVQDRVFLLGEVSRLELYSLMQLAAVVLQPSLFEGWSTSIQDAVALGRPVMCSSLNVHKEQAPEALGFFDPQKPESLATLLAEKWPTLPKPLPRPEALAQHRNVAQAYAMALGQALQSTRLGQK